MTQGIFGDIERLVFPDTNGHLRGLGTEHCQHIVKFLRKPDLDEASKLFKLIAGMHKKRPLFNLMDDLRLYEESFTRIVPDHREHFLHSASVYVLGLAIYNGCTPVREALQTPLYLPDDDYSQESSFLFRWALAACLHDLAYPLELSLKSFNRYSKNLHSAEDRYISISSDIYHRTEHLTYYQTKYWHRRHAKRYSARINCEFPNQ